jgi:DNA end-binding protein Ku
MPRALWTGSISFGLVNVPVRLYSAVSEHKLQFHFVHEKDESPIGYRKICKLEEKPVPDKEIVKAFEYRRGEYVYMEDEDFEAARVEGYKAIEITDFVPYLLRPHVLRGPTGGRREGLLAAREGDGGLGAGGDRQVRDA